MEPRSALGLLAIGLLTLPWASAGPGFPERDLPKDKFKDDITSEVQKLKERINAQKPSLRQKRGIVLFSETRADRVFSELTIPLWEEYARQQGQGFFLQAESILSDRDFAWTKTRTLMELLPKVSWRYVLVVTANAVPAAFNQTWEYAVQTHMKVKRSSNDDPSKRLVWAPWDCTEPDHVGSAYGSGVCHGPFLDMMILQNKPKTTEVIKSWHAKRLMDNVANDPFQEALVKTRIHYYDEILYQTRCLSEFARPESSFFPYWQVEAGRSSHMVRDEIHSFIKKHKLLGPIANRLEKETGKKNTEL